MAVIYFGAFLITGIALSYLIRGKAKQRATDFFMNFFNDKQYDN